MNDYVFIDPNNGHFEQCDNEIKMDKKAYCEHESDGQTSIIPYPMQHKCKKCGKFYK